MNNTEPLILVVEDEPKIAELLKDYLVADGKRVQIFDRGDGVADWVKQHNPDAVLLDIMLPGKDGLQVCREIRQLSSIPIIMITAKVEEIDRLLGLELGADDYICKPFSPREVVARVKATLRRQQWSSERKDMTQGLVVDQDRFVASVNGQVLDLTPVEFRMLGRLAGSPGRVYSRDQLQSTIYTDGRIVSDRTVDSHVKNLRRKLRDVYGDKDVITSIYGVGYRFE